MQYVQRDALTRSKDMCFMLSDKLVGDVAAIGDAAGWASVS
jgi:hypothetical protein